MDDASQPSFAPGDDPLGWRMLIAEQRIQSLNVAMREERRDREAAVKEIDERYREKFEASLIRTNQSFWAIIIAAATVIFTVVSTALVAHVFR